MKAVWKKTFNINKTPALFSKDPDQITGVSVYEVAEQKTQIILVFDTSTVNSRNKLLTLLESSQAMITAPPSLSIAQNPGEIKNLSTTLNSVVLSGDLTHVLSLVQLACARKPSPDRIQIHSSIYSFIYENTYGKSSNLISSCIVQ